MQEHPNRPVDVQIKNQPQVRFTAHLLIVFGILELAYGQWTAPLRQIQLNFMLLAVGLILYVGGTKVVAAIRWLALFLVIPAVALPMQQATLAPLELAMVQLRLYPAQVILFYLPLILKAGVVTVVAMKLNSEPVKAALRAQGITLARPWLPAALGLLLILGGTAVLRHALDGPDADHAAQLAAKKFGPKYKYFINRLNIVNDQGTTVYATVQMRNDNEALQMPVQWRR
jgi:hypothetical protein